MPDLKFSMAVAYFPIEKEWVNISKSAVENNSRHNIL